MTTTAERWSFDEFLKSEEAWDELVLASDAAVPFLCHSWLRSWWKHFGGGQEFTAVVVRQAERLLAAVPLTVRRARTPVGRMTIGEVVGTGPVPTRGMGLADKADLIVRRGARGARERLAVEMMGLLDRLDALDIKGFDAMSPTVEVLEAASPRPAATRLLPRSESPYLALDAGYEAYLRSRSRNFRKHLKKYWRLLEEAGPMSVARLDVADEAGAWMQDVFAVNERSWKADRGTNLFRAPEIRAFFADLVPQMAQRGRIDLWMIRLAGEPAVYELCFDFAGRLFSYNGAYRKDLQRASPGTALTATVIEAACANGRVEYDMLRGNEEYKQRWSSTARTELQACVPADHAASRVRAWQGIVLKARLKQWRWLEQTGDRFAGLLSRRRYGS